MFPGSVWCCLEKVLEVIKLSGELGGIGEQNWAKQLRKSENWRRGQSSLEALLRSARWVSFNNSLQETQGMIGFLKLLLVGGLFP